MESEGELQPVVQGEAREEGAKKERSSTEWIVRWRVLGDQSCSLEETSVAESVWTTALCFVLMDLTKICPFVSWPYSKYFCQQNIVQIFHIFKS